MSVLHALDGGKESDDIDFNQVGWTITPPEEGTNQGRGLGWERHLLLTEGPLSAL